MAPVPGARAAAASRFPPPRAGAAAGRGTYRRADRPSPGTTRLLVPRITLSLHSRPRKSPAWPDRASGPRRGAPDAAPSCRVEPARPGREPSAADPHVLSLSPTSPRANPQNTALPKSQDAARGRCRRPPPVPVPVKPVPEPNLPGPHQTADLTLPPPPRTASRRPPKPPPGPGPRPRCRGLQPPVCVRRKY
jgi:hypothetical protein